MATTERASIGKSRFEGAAPILSVRDIGQSIQYYESVLGFTRAAWVRDDSTFAFVARDRAGIYLCEGGQGQPGTWVWVGVENVETLHDEYQASGARILHGPTNYPWAMEIRVTDPDGHVLRFGSDSKPDRPFESFSPS